MQSIADLVGYSEAHHFKVAFKTVTGLTPGEYGKGQSKQVGVEDATPGSLVEESHLTLAKRNLVSLMFMHQEGKKIATG